MGTLFAICENCATTCCCRECTPNNHGCHLFCACIDIAKAIDPKTIYTVNVCSRYISIKKLYSPNVIDEVPELIMEQSDE